MSYCSGYLSRTYHTNEYETLCCHLYESGDRLHAKFTIGVLGQSVDIAYHYKDNSSIDEKRSSLTIDRICKFNENGDLRPVKIDNIKSLWFYVFDLPNLVRQLNSVGIPFYYEGSIKYAIIWLVWFIHAKRNDPFEINSLFCSNPNSISLKPDNCDIADGINFEILDRFHNRQTMKGTELSDILNRLPYPHFSSMEKIYPVSSACYRELTMEYSKC